MTEKEGTIHSTEIASVVAEFLSALGQSTGDSTMPVQQVLTMLAVYLNGEMSLSDLPKYTGVEKSSNSRNIAKLGDGEKPYLKKGPGWLESYADPMDRRAVIVRLTPKGKALMNSVASRTRPSVRRVLNA